MHQDRGLKGGRRSFREAQAQRRRVDELVEVDFMRISPAPHVDSTDCRKTGEGDDEEGDGAACARSATCSSHATQARDCGPGHEATPLTGSG
jgi:hypothetical protein